MLECPRGMVHSSFWRLRGGLKSSGRPPFRIALSRVRSATTFLSRVFFFSSSLSRLTWSVHKQPYYLRQRYYVCSVPLNFRET